MKRQGRSNTVANRSRKSKAMQRLVAVMVKALILIILPFAAPANEVCKNISPAAFIYGDSITPPDCTCGEELKNIEATLYKKLEIKAACGLEWPYIQSMWVWIDLTKEKISLDEYRDGISPFGEIYLAGKITLSGVYQHYETDGYGDKWFFADRGSIAADHSPLGANLRTHNLSGSVNQSSDLVPPSEFQQAICWEADAVIEVDGIWVFFGEQVDGAFPSKHKILSAENFRICEV